MTLKSIRPFVLVLALSLSLSPVDLAAQVTRSALVDSARRLIDDFNEPEAIVLLQRALNPALGAPNSPWERGVQLLAQTLIQTNRGGAATAWLRWAARRSPTLAADSANFTPALVAALQEARAFIASTVREPRAALRFDWSSATPSDSLGTLRVEQAPADAARAVEFSLEGSGRLAVGESRRLPAASYRVAVRATGLAAVDVDAEVLPGVTTVVSIALTPAAEVLTNATEQSVAGQMARIDATRMGESACSVGFVAGRQGLLVSSYRAIRGADALALRLPAGRVLGDNVRIAAYDVSADIAVLTTGTPRTDSLSIVSVVDSGSFLWAAHFPTCGDSTRLERVAVSNADRDSIRLAGSFVGLDQSPILVTNRGSVAGIAATSTSASALARLAAVLESARRNVSSGNLLTTTEVARREKHAFGEVVLHSSQSGARVRVSPIDRSLWPEVTQTGTLPFTFRGPMGRYLVEVAQSSDVSGRGSFGQTANVRREIVVDPTASKQVELAIQRKRRSLTLPILGGLAAGGLIAALMGGKKSGPPNPTTGGIVILLPQ